MTAAGDFTAGVEGFTTAGSISSPCSGRGIFPPFWCNFGYPFYEYYGNYPDHRNYGYDPGSSY